MTIISMLVLSGLSASAQGIPDFFYMLPAKYCINMAVETRKAIVSEYVQNGGYIQEPRILKIKVLDTKNGYLSVEGLNGTWEMCFWNMDYEQKMVGVCSNGCGPVCYNKFLVFYLYADGKLTQVEQIIIPKVEFFEFFRNDAQISDVVRFYNETHAFTYQLPRHGKDITCRYEWSLSFEDAEVKKFMKGDKMDLTWNNGSFIKGAVHW